MSAAEALSLLTRVAGGTDFQPESPDAPVQVLGTLEAFGLRFDHLWVVGLDDESWPKAASPDPFLPIRLQREAGVPRCSPERELAFATLVTQRLLASAADTVLSYPIREDDRDLSPSPLILSVPKVAPADLPRSENATCTDAIRRARSVEQIVDEQGPPLGQEAWQRGGSRVFQYQAACPFRAFVELRLGAEDLEAPVPGLDARQRGTLVHAALEEFWNEVRTHEALCNRPDIADMVRQAVAMAVERFANDRGAPLPERFAALERRRLERIVSDWLELEKLREPFEVIKPEGERDAEVGGIHFRVKIDRIDRIIGERDVIIDYKTGTPSVRSWESERPEEPQLPLYSVVYGERPLAGVLFGQLKTGEVKFKGLVDGAVVIPGADSDDLAARIAEWRRVMERLAADFRAGHAEADPKEPTQSCRYCSLACLCRIAECDAYWNLEAE
jgi:probable DNA repair protein